MRVCLKTNTMRKSFFTFLLLFAISGSYLIAQNCDMYFPDKAGSIRELTNFDKKGKMTGMVHQEFIGKDVTGNETSVTVLSKAFDKDSKELSSNQMIIKCKNGVFSIDMKDFIDKSMLEAYKEMEIIMTGDNINYPSGFKVGDKLEDASINIVVKNQGVVFMNWTITISNRMVTAQESISTDAGTFQTYKLTYDLQTKTRIMTINSKAAEWLCSGVGVIKSESYDKTGKLLAYSLLTKLKN